VARVTQLLSTRVAITRERQNRAVLETMNRRAKLQLRLQSTVEGLSIAAVTYYLVGLIGYAIKGLSFGGPTISPGRQHSGGRDIGLARIARPAQARGARRRLISPL